LIDEAHAVINTPNLPPGRSKAAEKLLTALALIDDLIARTALSTGKK
jgi:hypothetical protein